MVDLPGEFSPLVCHVWAGQRKVRTVAIYRGVKVQFLRQVKIDTAVVEWEPIKRGDLSPAATQQGCIYQPVVNGRRHSGGAAPSGCIRDWIDPAGLRPSAKLSE